MLVLTRNVGEVLFIGDDVAVTILRMEGKQVRIGIKAPKRIAIYRKEIVKGTHKKESA